MVVDELLLEGVVVWDELLQLVDDAALLETVDTAVRLEEEPELLVLLKELLPLDVAAAVPEDVQLLEENMYCLSKRNLYLTKDRCSLRTASSGRD